MTLVDTLPAVDLVNALAARCVEGVGKIGRRRLGMGREEERGESGVRLRDRSVAHQLAAGCGFLGVVWAVVLGVGGSVLSGSPAEVARHLVTGVVVVGVPAAGAWLATRPSDRQAQVGLMALATWGLLTVPNLVGLLARTSGFNSPVVSVVSVGIPVAGLVLAGRALTRGEGLAWRARAGWQRRLVGMAVAVYGLAAALPLTAAVGGDLGLGSANLSLGVSWLTPDKSVTVVVVAALGAAIARLATPLALAPAAIVAAHAVEHVATGLPRLLELAAAPVSAGIADTAYTLFAVHVIAAMTAVAATAWLATRSRRRSTL